MVLKVWSTDAWDLKIYSKGPKTFAGDKDYSVQMNKQYTQTKGVLGNFTK